MVDKEEARRWDGLWVEFAFRVVELVPEHHLDGPLVADFWELSTNKIVKLPGECILLRQRIWASFASELGVLDPSKASSLVLEIGVYL